jgi:hypothetical protein
MHKLLTTTTSELVRQSATFVVVDDDGDDGDDVDKLSPLPSCLHVCVFACSLTFQPWKSSKMTRRESFHQ